jgi:hypothetical protein
MPAVQPEARPDIECLHTVRSRNRQGVLLPPTQKLIKDIEIVSIKDTAPVNKRKSLPPVRGAGLKGRAAQMVGLATSKDSDAETKQVDVSLPLMVMSSLMAKSSAKPDESVNSNDKSPKTMTSPIAS